MFKIRKSETEKDYLGVIDMLSQNYSNPNTAMDFSPGVFEFCRYIWENDPATFFDSYIWTDQLDKVVGLAWPDGALIDIMSSFEKKEVEYEIIQWCEALQKKQKASRTDECNLKIFCDSKDTVRESILKKRSYQKTGYYKPFFLWSGSSKSIPAAKLPHGYSLSSVSSENEINQKAKLISLAMAGMEVTSERYSNMMKAPNYTNELDLIIKDESDQLVAFCTAWYDKSSKSGVLEPLGCAVEHRKKGITKFLLVRAIDKMIQFGGERFYVSTGYTNEKAIALYQRIGFKEHSHVNEWNKIM